MKRAVDAVRSAFQVKVVCSFLSCLTPFMQSVQIGSELVSERFHGGELLGKNRSALSWKRYFVGAGAAFVLKSGYALNE